MKSEIVASLVLLVGCRTVPALSPPGMVELVASPAGEALTKRYFPGSHGSFFTVATQGGGPVFGLVRDGKDPSRFFLAGIGEERGWSHNIPLESSRVEIEYVEPLKVMLGDLQKDGVPELMLVLGIKSRFKEAEGSQLRTAVYIYHLAKRMGLAFYQSLSLKGARAGECGEESVDYSASLLFPTDDRGICTVIDVSFELLSTKCAYATGPAPECESARNQGTFQLVWDPDLGVFRNPEKTDSLIQVPDVSL